MRQPGNYPSRAGSSPRCRAAEAPLTIFALNTILLDQSLAALAADGNPGEAAFGRGELAGLLNLLSASGAIDYDGYLVTLALAAATDSAA